ncbi:MAG: hypothetical protein ACREJC_22110 [Tepidisphaeraceae bacterium]
MNYQTILLHLGMVGAVFAVGGCRQPPLNPTPTTTESQSLTDIVQLTHGFDRAGEAYFSPDMAWIIFQAAPRGEARYQMYVAPVLYEMSGDRPLRTGTVVRATPLPGPITVPQIGRIVGIGPTIRISPENSRNTCGFFSPGGNSLIFGSTVGKEDPNEPPGGYQREGGTYRWSFSEGMEIYRADGWEGALAAADPGQIVDLARHRLTDNRVYDAECSYSPDGKWICFASMRTGDVELFAMRPDGSDVVQLTSSPGYDGGPFFSPDGKRLVYRSDRKGNGLLQIYVADVVFGPDGAITALRRERQLTEDANVNWGPFWHPGGKHIVYATSRHGHANYEVYLMRDDGSRKTRITFSSGADVLPVFSPDGNYLLWASKRAPDNTTQVFAARFKFPQGS